MDRSAPPAEPLLFQRILKEKVWGGRRLAGRLGLELPFEGPLGETWELSDVQGEETQVRGGRFGGRSLRELMEEHGPALLGASRPDPSGRFPLLVKLIEAGDDLSVQIHPPDGPFSPTGVGKTEAWYILDTFPVREGPPSVICGLREGTDPEVFRAEAGDSRVRRHLHEVPVAPGDCVFVPAGQTHAIRGGVILAEIQQTSDVTFRMYDWDRVGLDGRPRETHLEQALRVVDWDLGPGRAVRAPEGGPSPASLVQCPYFELREHRFEEAGRLGAGGHARVLVVVGGSGSLAPGAGGAFEPLPVAFGDVLLLPATLEGLQAVPDEVPFRLLEGIAL